MALWEKKARAKCFLNIHKEMPLEYECACMHVSVLENADLDRWRVQDRVGLKYGIVGCLHARLHMSTDIVCLLDVY